MTKILNGSELAHYIKERQIRSVRSLLQNGATPKLAIVQTLDDPVINTYVRSKEKYGNDLGVLVESYHPSLLDLPSVITDLNEDTSVTGIIIQLPLSDPTKTEEIVNLVKPEKDVDALADKTDFDPATPTAILWLLAGYNVELKGKHVLIIGKGRLVGEPLERMLKSSGIEVEVADSKTENLSDLTLNADVVISATGSPAIIHPNMIKPNSVIVDAGVATENGETVGDLAPSVYERDDLTITPLKGGVGPLTVCSLFENVIKAAREQEN